MTYGQWTGINQDTTRRYEAYEIAITRPRRRQTGYHCHEEN
jgi:hypothetical protein